MTLDQIASYERCIVTFIDILGFRNILNSLPEQEIAKAMLSLRHFAKGGGDELKDAEDRRSRVVSHAYSESVSDAVVRVRTVETEYSDGPFLMELVDLQLAIIECINAGILVRGGMTIGDVHLGQEAKGPIFGQGMVRAYEIESREAIYPRLMIDSELIAIYSGDETLWQDSAKCSYEVRTVRKFLGVSEDGSFFLDYLKALDPGSFDAGPAGLFLFLQKHKDLIVQHLNDQNDGKVLRKLVWLASYHNHFIRSQYAKYDLDDPEGKFAEYFGKAPKNFFDDLLIEEAWLPDFLETQSVQPSDPTEEILEFDSD